MKKIYESPKAEYVLLEGASFLSTSGGGLIESILGDGWTKDDFGGSYGSSF